MIEFLYKLLKHWEKHRLDKVAEQIEGDNLKVLEIGCRDGQFLYENRHKWQNVIGVDIASECLRQAKKRKYDMPTKFIRADYGRKKIPYNSFYFDLIVSIATLQYVYDLDLLFDEVYRVLKKGGRFIFEVPNIAVFWRRIQFLFGRLPATSQVTEGWDAGVIHYFTYYDLYHFLRKKGFKIEKVSCSGIFDKLREKWVDLLGADLIFVCQKTI